MEEHWTVVGPDTTFAFTVNGVVDASATRRYRQEGIIDTQGMLRSQDTTSAHESNTVLILENAGSHAIRNPQIEINGQRMLYRFQDLVDRIDLTGLRAVDDTIQAVWAFLNDNYYAWLVSTDEASFSIRPLRTFNVFGSGYCENAAQLMASILQYLGYDARIRIIGSGRHTIGSVLTPDGRELVFDPNMKVLYKDLSNTHLVGFTDLVGDQELARRQHHLGYAAGEGYRDGTIALFYSNLLSNATKPWTAVDSCPLVLRPGEKILFPYRQSPGTGYAFYHCVTEYNQDPPPPPPTASIGQQLYAPGLNALWNELIDRENVTIVTGPRGPALRPVNPDLPAKITIRCGSPYAVIAASAKVSFLDASSAGWYSVRFRKASDPAATTLVDQAALESGASTMGIDLTTAIHSVGTPTTNVFDVTIEWATSAVTPLALDSLALGVSFQFNPNALPRLSNGTNAIKVYATDGLPLDGLRYTHGYFRSPLDRVPPPVAGPMFPAHGAVVSSPTPEFRWSPPVGMPEGEIADYHIQVSERPDFRFPVSSVCDKFVTQTGGGAVSRWTIPGAGMLNPGTKYYWRVAAVSRDRFYGPWSPTQSFSVGGPATPSSLRIRESGDSLWLEWERRSPEAPGESFVVLGGNIRGFGPGDELQRDTVSVPRFLLKSRGRLPHFTFYRVIARSPEGLESGLSEQISLESYRLFAVPPEVATIGDSVRIVTSCMEPVERELISYSIYESPLPRVEARVDSFEITGAGPAEIIETGQEYLRVKIPEGQDSTLRIAGRTVLSQQQYSTVVPLRKNHRPQFASLAPVIIAEDSAAVVPVVAHDPDGDSVTLRPVSLPSWMVYDSAASNIHGVPRGGDVGTSTFTVRAIDSRGGITEENIPLQVIHVNHVPRLSSFPAGRAAEDSAYMSRIVAVDQDSAQFGDRVVYRLVGNPAWMKVDTSTGVVTGTPSARDVGSDTLTASVTDGRGGVTSGQCIVTVSHTNHPPEVAGQAVTHCTEDSVLGMTIAAIDRDSLLFGDKVAFIPVLVPRWCTIDTARGTVYGTPRIVDLGDSILQVNVIDRKGGETRFTTAFRIRHVNHAPTFAFGGAKQVAEDDTVRWNFTLSDPDTLVGDRLTTDQISTPSWLALDWPNRHWTGVPGARNVGDTIVSLRVLDADGLEARLAFAVTVRHINHRPIVTSTPRSVVVEDSLYSYAVEARDPDSEVFHDHVRFRLESHPRWLQIDSLSGRLSGTPGIADVGMADVSVLAVDDSSAFTRQDFTLTVLHVNHSPIFLDLAQKAGLAVEDVPYSQSLLAADPDSIIQEHALRYAIVVGPHWLSIDSVSGVASGVPREGDRDTILMATVTDGLLSDTLWQSITVQPVNDPPFLSHIGPITFFEDSSHSLSLDPYVSDPDDRTETLSWQLAIATDPGQGGPNGHLLVHDFQGRDTERPALVVYAASAAESLVAIIDVKTRVLTVRGSQNFFGVNIPLLVSVTDRGGLSAVDTVSVTIRPVNDGPTLAALAPVTLPEDDSLYLPVSGWAAALTDPDDDFDHHTWDLPATRHLNITRSQGGFTIRPVKNWNGVDTLRVAVTDPEGLSASVPMIVRVQPVNDPVVLHRLSSDSLAFTDILFRLPIECHDPDGPDSLIRYRWAGPEWLKITAGGTLEGRPRAIGDFSGVLYASDPEGGEDSVHIRLRVRSNDETHDLANSLPVDFVLKQNYPNPFNPSTTVRFGVPVPSEVRLTVYSLLGQRVELLLETSVPAGYHEVPWNARGLSSGVYILEMSARSRESSPRNFRELKKLILEK